MTLDLFSLWKKTQLQDYLKERELPVTGTKAELVALAFAAWTMKVPVKVTDQEKKAQKAAAYHSLLTINGKQLPDPFTLVDGWEGEETGRLKWPCTMMDDISVFLEKHDVVIGQASLHKRLLSDYKEGKAFSYFASNFLFEVLYHPVEDACAYCFLKTKCRPSFAVHDEPHDVWVCIQKETGSVESAFCTCFAGYG